MSDEWVQPGEGVPDIGIGMYNPHSVEPSGTNDAGDSWTTSPDGTQTVDMTPETITGTPHPTSDPIPPGVPTIGMPTDPALLPPPPPSEPPSESMNPVDRFWEQLHEATPGDIIDNSDVGGGGNPFNDTRIEEF